ncbi:MAG TPA: hypothetical protein ENI50_01190 [Euryarchaeota archaeon]|nr:MAG: hypothetical protein DRN45_07470 [Thermococci archaeon]HEC95621.1 hypothetical protein [Euryarchaeota archaeon]
MDVRKSVIEDFEGMVQGVGYDQVYGRIFGILWVSDKEKSLDEICKESSYALSTVSIVLKEMWKFGIVRRIKRKGDRKIYYKTDLKISDLFNVFLSKLFLEGLYHMQEREKDLKSLELKDKDKAIVDKYLKEMKEFRKMLEEISLLR